MSSRILGFSFVRAKTFTKLLLYIVYGIRHAFIADIINRLIIWQLGRAPGQSLFLSLFSVKRKQRKRNTKKDTHIARGWEG